MGHSVPGVSYTLAPFSILSESFRASLLRWEKGYVVPGTIRRAARIQPLGVGPSCGAFSNPRPPHSLFPIPGRIGWSDVG